MNERDLDFDLLQRFVRRSDQAAFSSLVRNHLDLVYGTAVRKAGDPAAAQEIAQNVFGALARKAWQFSPDDSLPAWLHRTTLLEAKHWLRGELRRRHREQTAAELGTTMKTTDDQPALRALVPMLDEALLSLREKDRAALLLRYYESRPLREVGVSLGISEDAAQKRVGSALEQIAKFFKRRGFKTASVAVSAAALQASAVPTPVALATVVTHAALECSPAALTGLAALLARLTSLTNIQATLVGAVLLTAPVSWQVAQMHRAKNRAESLAADVSAQITREQQLAADVESLRSRAARLETALSEPTETEKRALEATRALGTLKSRILALQTAGDYHWPDDLPFVCVPKWAVKNIRSDTTAFNASGRIAPWVEEVLNLSPEQKVQVESHVSRFLEDADRLAALRAYETNLAANHWSPGEGFQSKVIAVPALGEDGQAMENLLATNLTALLGDDGTKLILSPFATSNQSLSWQYVVDKLIKSPQQFAMFVKPGQDGAAPLVNVTWENHIFYGGAVVEGTIPQFLMDHFEPWLRQIGATNGIFTATP